MLAYKAVIDTGVWRKISGISRFVSCSSVTERSSLYAKGGKLVNSKEIGAFLKQLRKEKRITQEQLAVIFDAAQNMTTLNLVSNPEQSRLLEGIMKQIEEAAPQVIDLANELTQYPKQHELGGMEQI